MNFLNKLSFNTSIFSFIFIFFISIGFLFYNEKIQNFKSDIEKIKIEHEKQIKNILQKEISSAVDFINYKRENTLRRLKNEIKSNVNKGYNVANGIYESMKEKYSKKDILNTINSSLRDIRFFDDRSYFYIYQTDGKSILHPIFPEIENTYLHNKLKSYSGSYLLKENAAFLDKHREGFITYDFYHPKDKTKKYKKIAYIKKLPFYDIYIGTAEYIVGYENIIKKEIFQRLSEIRFGKDGYLFIDDYDGTILMHPMKPEIVGKNLINYKDINGKYVIKELIDAAKTKDGRFVYYNWHRPGTKTNELNKVSFAMGIQDWNWMIGGGLYIDDINNDLQLKQQKFKQKLHSDLGYLFLLLIIMLVLLFLIINWFNKRSEKSLTNMVEFFIKAGQNNIYLDQNKIYFKEFQELAKVINSMIDQRIKTEQQLKDKQAKIKRLEENKKLAAMAELVKNIAHHWRQPLNIISVGASGLKIKYEFGDFSKEYLFETCDSIDKNVQFLSKTIDSFNKVVEGDENKTKFNLTSSVNDLLHLTNEVFKRESINIKIDFNENINIQGYPNELTKCFISIINNSVEALKNKQYKKYIFISLKKEENSIIITFKDNGGGIDQEIISRIFEPYFTTKHQYMGTGLGLSEVHSSIINLMGGDIEVSNTTFQYDDENYKGAVFKITLPT